MTGPDLGALRTAVEAATPNARLALTRMYSGRGEQRYGLHVYGDGAFRGVLPEADALLLIALHRDAESLIASAERLERVEAAARKVCDIHARGFGRSVDAYRAMEELDAVLGERTGTS